MVCLQVAPSPLAVRGSSHAWPVFSLAPAERSNPADLGFARSSLGVTLARIPTWPSPSEIAPQPVGVLAASHQLRYTPIDAAARGRL